MSFKIPAIVEQNPGFALLPAGFRGSWGNPKIGSLNGEDLHILDGYVKVFCAACCKVAEIKHIPFTCPACGGRCISYDEAQARTAPRKTTSTC